jgi:DNA-binding CsgD family transcriptional regulator
MLTPESTTALGAFPLTDLELSYLREFAHGKTPTILGKNGFNERAASHASTVIKRKLAARTLAQGVWKASDVGIDLSYPDIPITPSRHPMLESIPKTSEDVLRMLAGGYHALEIDSGLDISRTKRVGIIGDLYSTFSSGNHPELVHHAIHAGFFNKNKPILFSEAKKLRLRVDDRLSEDQLQFMHLFAQGKTYRELAAELSLLKSAKVSLNGVRSRLDGLQGKIARLSGLPTKLPYQVIIRAVELGLFPLDEYLKSQSLDPLQIQKLPMPDIQELKAAYHRVLTTGAWVGNDRASKDTSWEAKKLRAVYLSVGAENPMQAILMLHALEKPAGNQPSEQAGPLTLPIPNGPTFFLTKGEINAVKNFGLTDIAVSVTGLPPEGYVSAEVENNGGRVVAILAGILKGDLITYTPRSTDLTYKQLRSAYQFISSILTQYPTIPNIGSLLDTVKQRLDKLNGQSNNS